MAGETKLCIVTVKNVKTQQKYIMFSDAELKSMFAISSYYLCTSAIICHIIHYLPTGSVHYFSSLGDNRIKFDTRYTAVDAV